MFSRDLENCLNDAFRRAREKRHEYMTVEHLLLALLDIPEVEDILRACNANVEQLRRELTEFIDQTTSLLSAREQQEVQPTLGFQRVLQRAVFHVQSSGKKEVTPGNVLVAIFSEKQSHTAYLLGRQEVSRLDVVNYISHGISKVEDEPDRNPAEQGEVEKEGEAGGSQLEKYTNNINRLAEQGRIDPLIGRSV